MILSRTLYYEDEERIGVDTELLAMKYIFGGCPPSTQIGNIKTLTDLHQVRAWSYHLLSGSFKVDSRLNTGYTRWSVSRLDREMETWGGNISRADGWGVYHRAAEVLLEDSNKYQEIFKHSPQGIGKDDTQTLSHLKLNTRDSATRHICG